MMTTDSVGETSNNGGGSGKQERPRALVPVHDQAQAANDQHARGRWDWGYHPALAYAYLRGYVSLALNGSGLVALLLSTVILLGGYVQSLGKKDFFCILAITVIQAAGIFQDWETNLQYLVGFMEIVMSAKGFLHASSPHIPTPVLGILLVLLLPFTVLFWCILMFYSYGPFACAAISSWRIAKLNHGSRDDGTDSMANMMAALNIFYSIIIFQGAMFGVLVFFLAMGNTVVARHLLALEQLSDNKWGRAATHRYIFHISEKCRKDPLSIIGMDLIKYAAQLLDSESQVDYHDGAMLLSAFINKGKDVSWVLLPSRDRIQRLIDSLMISSSCSSVDGASLSRSGKSLGDDKKEIRELAATIVAHVAAHIDDLSNYPGAMRCISSLLQDHDQTTRRHRNQKSKRVPDPPQRPMGPSTKREHYQEKRSQRLIEREERRHIKLMRDQKRMEAREHQHLNKREGGTSNELVRPGLTILERLASNSDDNRSIICSTPSLLRKITALIYSADLIEDVKTNSCWGDIVTRYLKVLYQLIRAPDGCHEVFSNNVQAMTNLKSILELGNTEADHQELQLVAMEILTELALDLSIMLTVETKEALIKKQVQLLFGNEEESATIAGRTMVSLTTNIESNNSALIMTEQPDIIGRLNGLLDDENITQRTIAAQIMANLCAHCNVDNDMMEILTKVLSKTKSQQAREEQEAFLSLAQVICYKLNSGFLDAAIQKAVQNENNLGSEVQRREAFVDKLKTIIDDNCHPTAGSLIIVKLCAQIAESTIKQCRQQYAKHFGNEEFKGSLSKASKTMYELESCMLFVGTDFGLKKTVKSLFSEIEKTG